ncbi:hypothetical protein Misp01_82090 [Microtetraspora sp. NBRC 13810]|nr:hypothetical protein Misp01_82090 [Microtetraspora sp. NBRC 13810]
MVVPGLAGPLRTALRVALGVAWGVLVPAEMFGLSIGRGYAVLNARDNLGYPQTGGHDAAHRHDRLTARPDSERRTGEPARVTTKVRVGDSAPVVAEQALQVGGRRGRVVAGQGFPHQVVGPAFDVRARGTHRICYRRLTK